MFAGLTALLLALPDFWLAQHTDISIALSLNFYRGQRVQLTRPIEDIFYDGDWTVIVFEETDDLPEVRAAFLWWDLPFEFDDDLLSHPQLQYTGKVAGTLAARNGQWIIDNPTLIRWN
jgi:hypothetical protein